MASTTHRPAPYHLHFKRYPVTGLHSHWCDCPIGQDHIDPSR